MPCRGHTSQWVKLGVKYIRRSVASSPQLPEYPMCLYTTKFDTNRWPSIWKCKTFHLLFLSFPLFKAAFCLIQCHPSLFSSSFAIHLVPLSLHLTPIHHIAKVVGISLCVHTCLHWRPLEAKRTPWQKLIWVPNGTSDIQWLSLPMYSMYCMVGMGGEQVHWSSHWL